MSDLELDMLEALKGAEDAIDGWRQRLSDRDMRHLSEDEHAILFVTHGALRAVIAKASGMEARG